MARELLIQDGKLTSDLDADHKTIKNLEGFATLDESGKVPASQLPSYVDDVLEFPATTDFPATGETGKIYVATSTGKVYRWSGSQYIEIANPDLSGYVTNDDPRLSDARTPTAHKSSHASGGSDAIAPSDIGEAASSHTHAASDITSGLAAVATSGAYSDLSGKPTIPAAQVNADWDETDASSKAYIQNKPTIPTVPTPVAPVNATALGQFADALATKSELAAKVALEEFSSGSWAQGSSYLSGSIVFYDGYLYLCSSDVLSSSTPPSEDPTHWDQVAVNYLMFLKADRSDIPSPSSTTPSMDGTAAVGVSDDYARADHVHPSDTSKADASALRYAMPASVALVAENDAATLVCADRAVTNATIASGFATLNLTFPAEVSGYVRDFYLRITVAAGESAPALSIPQGVTIENAGGAVPEIADGEASAAATTLVWFSETAPGVFTAKSETVKAVA